MRLAACLFETEIAHETEWFLYIFFLKHEIQIFVFEKITTAANRVVLDLFTHIDYTVY